VPDKVWLLRSGGKVVAELQVNDSDFPWLLAHVVALPGFEELRPLFDEELRWLDPESDEGLSLRDTDRSLWSTNGF
jgi:hypothetical protein